MLTEAEAQKKLCPLSYSQPGGSLNCIASGCMLWVRATGTKQEMLKVLHPGQSLGCCGLTGAGR